MMNSFRRSERRARWNFVLFGIFWGIALFFGGASRADVPSQLIVQLGSVLLISIALFQAQPGELRAIKWPLVFLSSIAIVIALQLIPLPPALWAQLPGRALYSGALEDAGLAQVWRPISLTPDLSLNALLSVLPALAAVLGLAVVDRELYPLLVPAMLVGIAASALIGLLQVGGGGLYFYDITNVGSAVGVFANRNHEALFIALSFPLLVAWVQSPTRDRSYRRVRNWLSLCAAAAIFPILLVTGSRAGLALGIASALAALALLWSAQRQKRRGEPRSEGWQARAMWLVPMLVGATAIAGTLWLARGEAIQRLGQDVESESRVQLLPTFARMAKDVFPTGSGFGSFDSIFRAYEPDGALGTRYLNQAHNELAQIVIEGGVLPVLLLLVFLAGLAIAAWHLWSHRLSRHDQFTGRAALVVLGLILVASLVDYPLRTSLISVVFMMSWILVLSGAHIARDASEQEGLAGHDE